MCCRHVVCAWLLSCHLLVQSQAQYIDIFDDVDVGGGLGDIDAAVDYGKNATRGVAETYMYKGLATCMYMYGSKGQQTLCSDADSKFSDTYGYYYARRHLG